MTSRALSLDAVLDKRFGANAVLRAATLAVRAGTVHALVGENGAGKSTLVRIVGGVLRANGGTLALGGEPRELARWDRRAARAAGVGLVLQHGAFAGTLSVVENALLGVEPHRGPLVVLAESAAALASVGTRVGLPVDPWATAGSLSLGARQRAEIVAALHHGARLLILDEPTAVLTPIEVDGLLSTLRGLAATGTTVVIVTHKLDEVRAVADDVTVLRAGSTVATFHAAIGNRETETESGEQGAASGERRADPDSGIGERSRPRTPGLDLPSISRAMVGTDIPAPTPLAAPPASAPLALALTSVSVGHDLHAIDLTVLAGELVGVAGVDGNGQRELALAIAGLVPHTGRVTLANRDVTTSSPAARLAAGLAHLPEDRQDGGLLLDASVAENLSLGRRDITGRFVIDRAAVARHAATQIAALDVRPPDAAAIVNTLSGGNQQKVVVGRELSRPSLTAVIAAQPTRGVDLGAVARIHDRLRAAAAAGAGVLVISADLDELLALCHRIVVLLRGRIVGECAGVTLRDGTARATLGELMTGVGTDDSDGAHA